MLERHKAQNEAWLRARADENDKERKELCKLRVCCFKITTHIYFIQTATRQRPKQLVLTELVLVLYTLLLCFTHSVCVLLNRLIACNIKVCLYIICVCVNIIIFIVGLSNY